MTEVAQRGPPGPSAPGRTPRGHDTCVRSGSDVVVEVEDVGGVVAALDLAQPLVVGAVGRPDGVVALVVAEVVEPPAGRQMRPEALVRLAGPADVGVGAGRVGPHGR